jgi:hypothetical protein
MNKLIEYLSDYDARGRVMMGLGIFAVASSLIVSAILLIAILTR